jgi:hypothetical protein
VCPELYLNKIKVDIYKIDLWIAYKIILKRTLKNIRGKIYNTIKTYKNKKKGA